MILFERVGIPLSILSPKAKRHKPEIAEIASPSARNDTPLCHCEGVHLYLATEAIAFNVFGWGIEEGMFTSSKLLSHFYEFEDIINERKILQNSLKIMELFSEFFYLISDERKMWNNFRKILSWY